MGIGIALTVPLGACSDGRWQSDMQADTTPRIVRVVTASSLAVPTARFIVVVFNAGHKRRLGLSLKHNESVVRGRVIVRLPDRDGQQDCSFVAPCQALYTEESDIASGVIPLRMRGTVTLERRGRSRYVAVRLRIVPEDEDEHSQRNAASNEAVLNLELKPVMIPDDSQLASKMQAQREVGGSRLREWQDEIARANAARP